MAGVQIVWVRFEEGWQVESFSDVVDLEELGERIRGVPETLCLLLGQGSQGLWKLSRDCWQGSPDMLEIVDLADITEQGLIVGQTSCKDRVQLCNELSDLAQICLRSCVRSLLEPENDLHRKVKMSEQRH